LPREIPVEMATIQAISNNSEASIITYKEKSLSTTLYTNEQDVIHFKTCKTGKPTSKLHELLWTVLLDEHLHWDEKLKCKVKQLMHYDGLEKEQIIAMIKVLETKVLQAEMQCEKLHEMLANSALAFETLKKQLAHEHAQM